MAKWNLLIAHGLFFKIEKSEPGFLRKLVKKIGLSFKEVRQWKSIATRISLKVGKKQIIEEFDGYFRKRRVKINEWDENYLPILTEKMSPRDYGKTQLVKQADVVMLLYLLSDSFSLKIMVST